MAQRLKVEVRDRIVAAAAAVFAERGYSATKLSDIGEAAGISTGNIYKYFDSKQALLDEIVTVPVAAELLRRLRTRLRAIAQAERWTEADAAGSGAARALLSFWIENRMAVLILLRGAEDTRFAHVRGLMVHEMKRFSVQYICDRQGKQALPATMLFVLQNVFARTLDIVADILAAYEEPSLIQNAFAAFWRYQLAGLQALMHMDESTLSGAHPLPSAAATGVTPK